MKDYDLNNPKPYPFTLVVFLYLDFKKVLFDHLRECIMLSEQGVSWIYTNKAK